MARRAGRYRAQLLLQSGDRRVLHEVLRELRPMLEADPADIVVDVGTEKVFRTSILVSAVRCTLAYVVFRGKATDLRYD